MIDHLVVAGPDLGDLVAWWTNLVGQAPAPGGSHDGLGTANALAGLGPHTYVELIGPDPNQPEPTEPRPFGIDHLFQPTLVTWAASVSDIDAAVAGYRQAGIDPGEPRTMSRTRPDGTRLAWRLATEIDPRYAGVVPFLIQWDEGTEHPAVSLDSIGDLVTFGIAHPDSDQFAEAVRAVAEIDIGVGPPEMVATVSRPDGTELLLGRT